MPAAQPLNAGPGIVLSVCSAIGQHLQSIIPSIMYRLYASDGIKFVEQAARVQHG